MSNNFCFQDTFGKILICIIAFAAGYILHGYEVEKTAFGSVSIPTIATSFHYNYNYSKSPDSENSDDAWNSLLPEGRGFISDPEKSSRKFAIAAFHQLHCVNMLRFGYYGSMSKMDHVVTVGGEGNRRLDSQAHYEAHLRHCFDYLRQSIMCAADSNIEPMITSLGGVTGWGSPRVCRDFDRLVDYAERHAS